jgi:hypothetical protein
MLVLSIMPLGQVPRWLYIEQRIEQLKDYIHNYMESDLCVPSDITDEYNQLIEEQKNLKN